MGLCVLLSAGYSLSRALTSCSVISFEIASYLAQNSCSSRALFVPWWTKKLTSPTSPPKQESDASTLKVVLFCMAGPLRRDSCSSISPSVVGYGRDLNPQTASHSSAAAPGRAAATAPAAILL